jgi:replicative DNA helicase
MGRAALAGRGAAAENRRTMGDLHARISELIASPERDLDRFERTLTDGYAHALMLEAERRRLELRLTEVALSLQPGDPEGRTTELSELAQRLDGTAGELGDLRGRLSELRRLRPSRQARPERTA